MPSPTEGHKRILWLNFTSVLITMVADRAQLKLSKIQMKPVCHLERKYSVFKEKLQGRI